MASPRSVRELLLEQLTSRNAHVSFEEAVKDLTAEAAGANVDALPHTIWDLIEHIRLAQDDIIEFCRNPDYKAPQWPDDYWPAEHQPAGKEQLADSIAAVRGGIELMAEMVSDPNIKLRVPFAHGSGQTLFREAMLIVDHNAYHIGQIIQIRRLLGSW